MPICSPAGLSPDDAAAFPPDTAALAARTCDEDAIHKALASPVRRAILSWLKEPERYFPKQQHSLSAGVCAGQIEERCALAQSTVSGHLSALQQAGLVTAIPVGQWVFYRRNEAAIEAFVARLATGL